MKLPTTLKISQHTGACTTMCAGALGRSAVWNGGAGADGDHDDADGIAGKLLEFTIAAEDLLGRSQKPAADAVRV